MTILIVITLVLSIALLTVWLRWRQAVRADYIRTYQFPSGIYAKLQFSWPGLSLKECQLAGRSLRQFFLAHLKSGRQFVAMPSLVAADLWRELAQHQQHYEEFCEKAFGRFMHPTPAVALGDDRDNNAGLRRTWRHTCIDENIDPLKPLRLPLLFALDAKLNVPNGFRYAPKRMPPDAPNGDNNMFGSADRHSRSDGGGSGDCGTVYYGEDFSSTSYDGCTDGLSDSSSSDSCGDGGGGDGGGGGD